MVGVMAIYQYDFSGGIDVWLVCIRYRRCIIRTLGNDSIPERRHYVVIYRAADFTHIINQIWDSCEYNFLGAYNIFAK